MATVIIVDDETGIVDETRDFFEEEGHEVHTADSGEGGLELVRKYKPQILLLDIKLPDISGLLVLEEVKKISPDTKIIVITGYVDQSIIDEGERLGRDAFLQKPFNFEALKTEVDRFLGP